MPDKFYRQARQLMHQASVPTSFTEDSPKGKIQPWVYERVLQVLAIVLSPMWQGHGKPNGSQPLEISLLHATYLELTERSRLTSPRCQAPL